MALPSTITGAWPLHRNQRIGPFQIGSNLYVITGDNTGLGYLRMYKSTDGGSTWNEQDSMHAPALASSGSPSLGSVDAVLVGSTIHVAYGRFNGSVNQVALVTFASDAWGTPITGGPTIDLNHIAAYSPVYLAVRSNGDRVVLYQAAMQSLMGSGRRRFCAVIYSGSAWGTPFGFVGSTGVGQSSFGLGVKDHYDLRTAILGASDRVHVIYSKASAIDTLWHQSFTAGSAGGADAEASAAANGFGSAPYSAGVPVAFANGGNTEIAFVIQAYISLVTCAAVVNFNSGANPSITVTRISDSGFADTTNTNPGAVAVSGTTKYAFWVETTTSDLYRDSDAGTNTWGTDAAQESGITCQGVNAIYTSNAIGVLFNDNGTVKFDSYSLAPPGVSDSPPDRRTRRLRVLVRR